MFSVPNTVMSDTLTYFLQNGAIFLEAHGMTIIVATVVFATLSFINASMTQRDSQSSRDSASKGVCIIFYMTVV